MVKSVDRFYDVIIAGAGPVGLLLACELALAPISVLVLEREAKLESRWKIQPLGMRGLNTLSVEMFYRRGLLGKLFGNDRPPSFQKTAGYQHGGHFAGIMLNANSLDLNSYQYYINGPALQPGGTTVESIESLLDERAENLGVTILRGTEVTEFSTDKNGVTVEAGGHSFGARWVVGCDGGRSTIRKAAQFDFVGTEPLFTGYAVECDFDHPEKLKPGFNVTENGMYIVRPHCLYLVDFDGGASHRTREITQGLLQDILNHITGKTDVHIIKVHLASSFTDRSKQTTSYRKGRVLLAGDAAHIHPPMGQGLNLGLGDAMNLGWKLASTIQQEARSNESPNFKLLDTYETERHPIGASVLQWTRAQTMAMQPDLHGAAVYETYRSLLRTVGGNNKFIDRFWGLSHRYDVGDGKTHPLVGCSAPDFELHDGSRLGSKLERGQGLLITFDGNTILKDITSEEKYSGKVDYIGIDARDRRGISALLVRPDGVVAWATDDCAKPGDREAAKTALDQWFSF
jgi:2-polyprenyl-6-methoxyphenol hydroxylase-like FAD-dependent oxidoreductase